MNTKTLSNLKKFFSEKVEDDKKLELEEMRGVMDPSNCLMYIGKTSRDANAVYSAFQGEPQKIPDLEGVKDYVTARYSKEMLKLILKTLIESDGEDSITLSIAPESSIVVEDSRHAFMLAPRVSDDDKLKYSDIVKNTKDRKEWVIPGVKP